MLQPKYVVTMADHRMHDGTIYAAVGFDYHGLMDDRGIPDQGEVEFHVFTKSYDSSLKCIWDKIKFDKIDY